MSGQPKPIYVIYGPDEFLREQNRLAVTAEVLGAADAQLCVSRYDAEPELAAVLDDLRTLPFLGDRRVVIVDPADSFVSSHRLSLEKYLEAPAPSGTLILMLKTFRTGERLYKIVAKIGQALECRTPDAGAISQFIRDRAKESGRQIEPAAVQLMVEWLGLDRARAASELEKLVLYTLGRAVITAEDVSAVVVATAAVNPFTLTDALMEGNARKALEILDMVLVQSGEEYRLLGMLGWHLRRVLKAKHLIAAGRGEYQAFQEAKVFGPGQSLMRRLLARKSLDQIAEDFRKLIRADLAIKTGRDGKATLQSLVVSLC